MDLLEKAKKAAENGDWIGESILLAKLHKSDEENFSLNNLAELIGKHRSEIARKVAIGNFPSKLIGILRQKGLSFRTAYELLPLRIRESDRINYSEIYKALELENISLSTLNQYVHDRLAEIQTAKFENLLQDFLSRNPHIKVEEINALRQVVDSQMEEIRKNFRNQELNLRNQIANLKAERHASAAQKVNTYKRDSSNFVAKTLLLLSHIQDLDTEEIYRFLDEVEDVCKRLNNVMTQVEMYLHPNHDGILIDLLSDSVEQEK